MRIGILTDPANLETSPEFPLNRIRDEIEKRGHEIIELNTLLGEIRDGVLTYPAFQEGDCLDTFISWIPPIAYYDGLTIPPEGAELSYFAQLERLSGHYPNPMPYKAQLITNNKKKMSQMFKDEALPIPQTYNGDDPVFQERLLDSFNAAAGQGRIWVAKPDFGYGGNHVVKIDSLERAICMYNDFNKMGRPFIIQEYIEGHNVDYRAFVVGDKVVGGIKRLAKDGDWRGNFQKGSNVFAYSFSPRQEQDAIIAMKAAGLEFGAVDILIDPTTGRHYICEINDCAGIKSIESTHENLNVAALIVDMIEERYGPCPSPDISA